MHKKSVGLLMICNHINYEISYRKIINILVCMGLSLERIVCFGSIIAHYTISQPMNSPKFVKPSFGKG